MRPSSHSAFARAERRVYNPFPMTEVRRTEARATRTNRMLRGAALAATLGLFASGIAFGCGARTGLRVDEAPEEPALEAGADVVVEDAIEEDAAAEDAASEDVAPEDALPPVEAGPDVVHTGCEDASALLVYVITEQNALYSFDPPSGTFTKIGAIACPDPNGATPFSMAVDRKGIAYVLFSDGLLYQVSTATASCTATSFVAGQHQFQTFGMGFVADTADAGETLFVASDQSPPQPSLGRIDPQSLVLDVVAPFVPTITAAELTGTGEGRLFAYYTRSGTTGSFVGEIDKTTAKLIAETPLPTVQQGSAWAFAFWGGDFWLFGAPDGSSHVWRYRPSDQSVVQVGTLTQYIVGAGVSTCAPGG
jgi:hypothetical protein